MTLLQYLAALANKLNGIDPQPGMTNAEKQAFNGLLERVQGLEAKVAELEESTAPLVGEIDGLPALD